MKHGADWPAWLLQFIFGLIVGAALGFRVIDSSSGANSLTVHELSRDYAKPT
jgi:hypothetical protein